MVIESKDDFFNQPVHYWFNQLRFLPLNQLNRSTAIPGLNRDDAYNQKIALPPLAEQKVIAEKLDTLLAQVETTKARLDRIPNILKRFRQSVLAAAVSGKLTEEWRQDWAYNGEGAFADFPRSWIMSTIDQVASVKGGKRLPKGEELSDTNTGHRYIRAGQLKRGTIITGEDARNKQMYVSQSVKHQIHRYIVNSGDAYLTIVGASIGDAGVVPPLFDGANLTENAAKICEFKVPTNSEFMGYWLRSHLVQNLIQQEIKSGAQGKLALMRIKKLPFPVAPLVEQTQIVNQVKTLFAHADAIEKQVQAAQTRVDSLTQSILAKAFRGELTAGWRAANPELISGENSAEALLAKIKAEREVAKPVRKKKANSKAKAKKKV